MRGLRFRFRRWGSAGREEEARVLTNRQLECAGHRRRAGRRTSVMRDRQRSHRTFNKRILSGVGFAYSILRSKRFL
jgi:hypothetical protein